MGPDRNKHLRNIAIILLLAVAVWKLPGGGTASRTIENIFAVLFVAGMAFFGYRMYMENRTTLFDLPDRLRVLLYGSVTLMIFALVATSRMWNSGGAFVLLWFALIGIAVYGFATVLRAYREY